MILYKTSIADYAEENEDITIFYTFLIDIDVL